MWFIPLHGLSIRYFGLAGFVRLLLQSLFVVLALVILFLELFLASCYCFFVSSFSATVSFFISIPFVSIPFLQQLSVYLLVLMIVIFPFVLPFHHRFFFCFDLSFGSAPFFLDMASTSFCLLSFFRIFCFLWFTFLSHRFGAALVT